MRLSIVSSALAALALTAAGAAEAKPAPTRTINATSAGKAFADCRGCPEMMPIPAGSFMMGVSSEEEERHKVSESLKGRAQPVHRVTIARSFAMGRYPVTVAQFRAFVDETGYQAPESCTNQRLNDGHFIYEKARGYSFRSPGFAQGDNYPVVCVSAEDAEAYADWLSKKTGRNYALPSEAQYEYALRAGTTTSYFWGEDRTEACKYSNQPDLAQGRAMAGAPMGPDYRFQCDDGFAYTSPVGHYLPNAWGLYDMQGNIWEWVADCLNNSHAGAPADGSARRDGDCDARPSKGGSFGNAVFSAMAGVRAPRHATYVGHSWGFRIVRND